LAARLTLAFLTPPSSPQLNIANPPTGTQKKVEIDNLDKLCVPCCASARRRS